MYIYFYVNLLVTITVIGSIESIEIEIVINKSLMTKLQRLVVGERERT